MKNGKNISKKIIRIGAMIVLAINLYACGASNNVVSNRLIQKRKYTKGWFVQSSKSAGQNKKKEVRAEKQLIRANADPKNLKETKLKLKKASSLRVRHSSPLPDFSAPFMTKRVIKNQKKESLASVVSECAPREITEIRSKVNETSISWLEKGAKSKRKSNNIDWENVALFAVGGLLILGLILAIILDSAPLLAVVFLIGAAIFLVILVYGFIYIFQGIASFFDMMFR